MQRIILNVLKFLGFVVLIPTIVAITQSIYQEMSTLNLFYHKIFSLGITVYVFLYFFVYDFAPVFTYGQSLLGQIFKLFGGGAQKFHYIFPIFTILLLAFYYIYNSIGKLSVVYGTITSFMIAVTFAMHIIMTAAEMYDGDADPFKPSYAFWMSVVYLANIAVLAILFSIVFPKFDFMDFFNSTVKLASRYYSLVWNHLF